jgi:predicted transcriptional regulator
MSTIPTMLKRFKKQLIDLDLTQAEIARKFGWSGAYVRDLMGGMAVGPAAERNRAAVNAFLAKIKEEAK